MTKVIVQEFEVWIGDSSGGAIAGIAPTVQGLRLPAWSKCEGRRLSNQNL